MCQARQLTPRLLFMGFNCFSCLAKIYVQNNEAITKRRASRRSRQKIFMEDITDAKGGCRCRCYHAAIVTLLVGVAWPYTYSILCRSGSYKNLLILLLLFSDGVEVKCDVCSPILLSLSTQIAPSQRRQLRCQKTTVKAKNVQRRVTLESM